MSTFNDLFKSILDRFLNQKNLTANYLQYHHRSICSFPCKDCPQRNQRIYKNGEHIKLSAHPHCDCFYKNVETKKMGTISKKQPSPDLWLKFYGKLPDYYITKEKAREEYGWEKGKNLSLLAPNKMLGGDIYNNRNHILPEKNGRVWFECDIDYVSGKRNSLRMYYSNDGLFFYSPDHLDGNVTVYEIN